jgi:hypothetical protein
MSPVCQTDLQKTKDEKTYPNQEIIIYSNKVLKIAGLSALEYIKIHLLISGWINGFNNVEILSIIEGV